MRGPWKIGELAKLTGLTVRALRHYDQIGLLTPSGRSDSGYRLYGEADVVRLQQILSLRQLGFSLRQIHACLGESRYSLAEVVALHLERVRGQIELQRELLRRLETVAPALAADQDVTVARFIEIIEVMNMMEKYGFDPGFSPEEEEKLKQRGEALGQEKIREVEREWPELIAKVQAEMDAGTPPSDPKIRALAKRWMELVNLFSGGDPEVEHKLAQAYRGAPKFGEQFGLTPEIMAYVRQACE